MELKDKINKLTTLISKQQKVVAFTGAGISTESGIPDFRGPKGIWKKYRPIELNEFLNDSKARLEYWRRKIELYPAMQKAQPNAGHKALYRLFQNGYLDTVVTQNIDGLHQKAGIPDEKVWELHGSNTYIRCLKCYKRYEWKKILDHFEKKNTAPPCNDCGGWLKPATISFGQAMPEKETGKAFEVAGNAKIILAIGTSLMVYPAADIPQETHRRGGDIIIINNSPTPLDGMAHMVLRGEAGSILSQLAEEICDH